MNPGFRTKCCSCYQGFSVLYAWLLLLGDLHVSRSIDVSISMNPDRYTADMNSTIRLQVTALYPGVRPDHIAWSTGGTAIFEWTKHDSSVKYNEEWPWNGRLPEAPVASQAWHTISFMASRCDGIYDDAIDVTQVRRDGSRGAVDTASAGRRSLTTGSYTILVSAVSPASGALPETYRYVKTFPIEPKIGSIDFTVRYQGKTEPIQNRRYPLYTSRTRGSSSYRYSPNNNNQMSYSYRNNNYKQRESQQATRRTRDSPGGRRVLRQILSDVTSHVPIHALCKLRDFYPAPTPRIYVDDSVVSRGGARQFPRDHQCLHSGNITTSLPVVVTSDAVRVRCVVTVGNLQVERVIELRPTGYVPPPEPSTTLPPPTPTSQTHTTSSVSLPRTGIHTSNKLSVPQPQACSVGELWGCIERTSPVQQHINDSCLLPHYCLNPVNAALEEVSECLALLMVCWDTRTVSFNRMESARIQTYQREAMIQQELCQHNKDTCFSRPHVRKDTGGFPSEAMITLVTLLAVFVTAAVVLCSMAWAYRLYYRRLYKVSGYILPWPGKRIYNPTPISASAM